MLSRDQELAAINKRLRLLTELEWADMNAQRNDWTYDPDGRGIDKIYAARQKLHERKKQLQGIIDDKAE